MLSWLSFIYSLILCLLQYRFGAWPSGGLEVQMFKLALMLIEVQMLNLALMPPFCQTPVMGWFYYLKLLFDFIKKLSICNL